MHIPFNSPTTVGIFGPSQVGKSFLLSRFLLNRNEVFSQKVEWVLYCYSVKLPFFSELKESIGKNITFHQGIPSKQIIDKLTTEKVHGIIILDDLMHEVCNNAEVFSLFTIGSHHLNISVIFIGQNIFHSGRFSRSISLNLHYIIVFKNLSDSLQIKHRARQIFPGKTEAFMEIFHDATNKRYGYLMIDLSPKSEDEVRLRTNVLPGEKLIVYSLD